MTGKRDVEFASMIAKAAHRHQKDKAGEPYFLHPRRVANSFKRKDYEARVVGWLHDVIEDTEGPVQSYFDVLIEISFDRTIYRAVMALTHKKNEPREEYYARIKAAGDLAVRVKIADIWDNLNSDRLALLDEPTRERLVKKYTKALEILGG